MTRFPAAVAERAASLLVLLGAWEGVAWFAHSRLFPGPGTVMATLADDTMHGELLYHLGATLARVAVAFALAMSIGSAIGIAMARSRALDALLDSWVVLFLNLPALVLAVLLYVWLGRPDGIGYAIQVFFQLFDVKRLTAYSLAFVAVVLAIEWGILQPFERRLARW